MKIILALTISLFYLLPALSKEPIPTLFIVGQEEGDVVQRAQHIFNTKQAGQGGALYDLNLDFRYYFLANHQVVCMIFYKQVFVQMEIIRKEAISSLKVREDYKDPKDTSGYPVAYVVEKLGNTIEIGRVFSRDKLNKYLAEST